MTICVLQMKKPKLKDKMNSKAHSLEVAKSEFSLICHTLLCPTQHCEKLELVFPLHSSQRVGVATWLC